MVQGIRLDKFLADAGEASRRQAKEMIRRAVVKVDGRTVTEPGMRIDTRQSTVSIDGRRISTEVKQVYIKMHKPTGYITSTDDPEGRPTVMDLLPDDLPRVFPVGRLDYHSAGLLFLTNDGDWAQKVAHPAARVCRVYEVWVQGEPEACVLRDLRRGIRLADGPAAFDRVQVLFWENSGPEKRAKLRVVLREGRNREVRRMLATVGHPVIDLKRTALGEVDLADLRPGHWRYMTKEEIRVFR